MTKLKVKPEGRKNIWIPEKSSLISFIRARKLKQIHNFIPTGSMMLGADHQVDSVIGDIEKAERLAVFTDPNANMDHSLAIIADNRLECYDIGEIKKEELEINA